MASPPPGSNAISADNLGPAVNFAVFIPMIAMCSAVLIEVSSKFVKTKSFEPDDYVIAFAMAVAIAQGITVSAQVPNGAGKHEATLTSDQIDGYQKAGYASEFLYVLAVGLVKLSTIAFSITLAQSKVHRSVCFFIASLSLAWTLIGTFGVAFQCTGRAPTSWAINSSQCFDRPAFWDAFEIIGIVTDLFMVSLIVWMIAALQMPRSKKAYVIATFAVRIITVPAIAFRLLYIAKASDSADHTYDDFAAIVATQVLMNLQVIVSATPFLKTFIQHLNFGGLNGGLTSNVRTWYSIGSPDAHRNPESNFQLESSSRSISKSPAARAPATDAGTWLQLPEHEAHIGIALGGSNTTSPPPEEFDGADAMVIRRTQEMTVETERTSHPSPARHGYIPAEYRHDY